MVLALRSVNDADPRPSLPELQAVVGRTGGRAVGVERLLAVREDLAALLPLGGIRRGTVAEIAHGGLLYATLANAMSEGAWAVVVGAPSLGLAAAVDHGVPIDRLAVVATPPPQQAAVVVAALVDAIDLVVLGPEVTLRPSDARRLSARLRERNGVLFSMGAWPDNAELKLAVTSSTWEGTERGHGHLRGWSLQVAVSGRGAAAQIRRGAVCLGSTPPLTLPTPGASAPEEAHAQIGVPTRVQQFSLERVS